MRRFVDVPRNLPLRNGRMEFGELKTGREYGMTGLAKESALSHAGDRGMSRHCESDGETNKVAKRMQE